MDRDPRWHCVWDGSNSRPAPDVSFVPVVATVAADEDGNFLNVRCSGRGFAGSKVVVVICGPLPLVEVENFTFVDNVRPYSDPCCNFCIHFVKNHSPFFGNRLCEKVAIS